VKIIRVELEISYLEEDPTENSISEETVLRLEKTIEDRVPSLPSVEELTAEALRRYKTLNARKTN